jgi:hypothetical protein
MTDIVQTDTPNAYEREYPYLTRVARSVATLVSYIFHPVFMPFVMVIFLYKLAPVNFAGIPVGNVVQRGSLVNLLVIIAGTTVFFPLLTILLMKALGFVRTIEMHETKDRILPLMAIMVYYFWAYHVISHLPGTPFILRVLLLGSFWGIIAVFMVNIFAKISMHASAAGGTIGILLALLIVNPIDMVPALYTGLLLAGAIGTARLILGAHKPAEVWWGYLLGTVVMFSAFVYLK